MDKDTVILKHQQETVANAESDISSLQSSNKDQEKRLEEMQAKLKALGAKSTKKRPFIRVHINENKDVGEKSTPASYDELFAAASKSLTERGLDVDSLDYHDLVSEEELEAIKKAISVTEKAFKMAARNIKKCKTENEVEAWLDYEVRKEGVRFNGFEPIIASGMNGTTLHYEENNSKIEKDALVLFDIGYE